MLPAMALASLKDHLFERMVWRSPGERSRRQTPSEVSGMRPWIV